jgi:hypothetical protein
MKILLLSIVWIVGMTMLVIMTLIMLNQPSKVAYDCRLAEIAVDYPQEVKRECRELMKAGMI